MITFGSFLPSLWSSTTTVYSGLRSRRCYEIIWINHGKFGCYEARPPTLIVFVHRRHLRMSVRYSLRRRAQKRRELTYQTVLGTYSQGFKSGMTRKEVEDRLRAKNVSFRQMCCVDIKEFKNSSWDDLVKIGEEDVPWVCGG